MLTPDAAPRWYRVRNEGWSGRPGPWSDAVRLDPPPRRLAAPRLEVARDPLTGTTWSWGAVEGAAGYLLERGLVKRKPAYADYIARTSAFFPLPPRPPHG